MIHIQHELGRKHDGTRIVRNYFVYPNKKDWFKETHKEFAYNEKKLAKLRHKNS